jgi:hypothetical protein
MHSTQTVAANFSFVIFCLFAAALPCWCDASQREGDAAGGGGRGKVAAARALGLQCKHACGSLRYIIFIVFQVLEDDASDAVLQRMRDGDGSSSSSSSNRMEELGSMKGSVRPQVDPLLLKFQTRVSFNPDQVHPTPFANTGFAHYVTLVLQVLRYCMHGPPLPLWLSSTPLPPPPPPCELCGGPRCFEFQVMMLLLLLLLLMLMLLLLLKPLLLLMLMMRLLLPLSLTTRRSCHSCCT